MQNESYYRGMFKIGAVWNFGAGLLFMLARNPLFDFLGMAPLHYTTFYNAFCMAVLLFGAGYYWVGIDLTQNRAIVVLGAIGKVLVFALFVLGWRQGELPFLLIPVGTVDLVFAGLFVEFLRRSKESHARMAGAR
ncbi:MAG: hypothetical protein KDH09_17010 [Chrysiogenetes bacterium]|nr:hypothetical protein [Chrysiogenetes bacterium]